MGVDDLMIKEIPISLHCVSSAGVCVLKQGLMLLKQAVLFQQERAGVCMCVLAGTHAAL